jgi:ankyrin repeat protein
MKPIILSLVVLSLCSVGCGDRSVNRRGDGGQEAGSGSADPDGALQDAIVDKVAKPLAEEMVKGLEKNAPQFLEEMRKQRNFTSLHQAAWDNKVAVAEGLLAAGADVNARDVDGCTPLHSAAFAFGAEVIPVLLKAGADINARNKNGDTPLHHAMLAGGGGGDKAIPYLIKGKADVNMLNNRGLTPLLCAFNSMPPSIKKIEQLVAAGAKVNSCPKDGVTALHLACTGCATAVDVLVAAGAKVNARTNEGRTPLHYAAEAGQKGIVALLLKAKAEIDARDAKGWSAMGLAADTCRIETAAALRDAGAREDSWTKLHEAAIFDSPEKVAKLLGDKSKVNVTDVYGRTPLYWALRCNDEKAADTLIDAAAALTVADKQHKTILQVAAWAQRPDIVKKAVAAGADVNAADDDGYTALHWAAASDTAETGEFLIAKHARVNVASKSGETPLMMALSVSRPKLVRQLLDAGADALATDKEGRSVQDRLRRVFDKETESLVEKAIQEATERKTDAICRLYSVDNPNALKADAIKPTTPNLAAVKMYRALFGADKKAFLAMFVGRDQELAAVAMLYDVNQNSVAFRKELTRAYGPDACQKFNALKIDGMAWNFTLSIVDETEFKQVEVELKGDQAVCHRFPRFEQCGDVRFVRQDGGWCLDASFLAPAPNPEAYQRLFTTMNRCAEKGRSLLAQSGSSMEDVKRTMWKEFLAGMKSRQ